MREEIISAFKKSIFSYKDGFQAEKETDEETEEKTDEQIETAGMSDLESKESAAHRKRNQQEKA